MRRADIWPSIAKLLGHEKRALARVSIVFVIYVTASSKALGKWSCAVASPLSVTQQKRQRAFVHSYPTHWCRKVGSICRNGRTSARSWGSSQLRHKNDSQREVMSQRLYRTPPCVSCAPVFKVRIYHSAVRDKCQDCINHRQSLEFPPVTHSPLVSFPQITL